jgi:glutathione S-transferase
MPNAGATRKRLMRAAVPAMRPVVRRDYHATESTAVGYLAAIRAAMDRVEAELQPSGYLVGDTFTVADLTAAALFTPTVLPPERQYPPRAAVAQVQELRDELDARPGGRWVHEMFAKHRGTSAEVRR